MFFVVALAISMCIGPVHSAAMRQVTRAHSLKSEHAPSNMSKSVAGDPFVFSGSEPRSVVVHPLRRLDSSVETMDAAENERFNGTDAFRNVTISSVSECAPPVADHLLVWQVFSDQSALRSVNDHNLQLLPEGSQIVFIEHHYAMLEYAKNISTFLERCRNMTGFYDSVVMLRCPASRANMVRAGLLFMFGGLWMDHKTVLLQPLSSFINLTSDAAVMPLDKEYWSDKRSSKSLAVQNSFLFSRSPLHPAFEHIIRLQIQHVRERYYGPTVLSATGPLAYALGLDYYLGNISSTSALEMLVRDLQIVKIYPDSPQISTLHDGSEFRYSVGFFKIGGSGESESERAETNIVAVWEEDLHSQSHLGHNGRNPVPYGIAYHAGLFYCDSSGPRSLLARLKMSIFKAFGYGGAGHVPQSIKDFGSDLPPPLDATFEKLVVGYEMDLHGLCSDLDHSSHIDSEDS